MAGQKFQYDESGGTFFYFLLSFLALLLIPGTYYYFPRKRQEDPDKGKNDCPCVGCIKKRKLLQTREPWKGAKECFQILILAAGWAILIFLAYYVSQFDYEYANFDPYEILGVPMGAPQKDIKKAYRKLSLILHPDKESGDEKAFMKLTKAYQALTDDEARSNWEKYGNPDGPGAMSFGIALPSWIVEKKNSVWVLGVYALVFMVALPTVVGFWWYRSIRYSGDQQVLLQTTEWFLAFLHAQPISTRKRCIMILGCALEFYKELNDVERIADFEALQPLIKKLPDVNVKTRRAPMNRHYAIKARTLIYAYLERMPVESKALEVDQVAVIRRCPYLLQEMVTCVTRLIAMAYNYRGVQQTLLKVTTLENVMKLSQMVVQAMNYEDSTFLQLPYVQEEHLKHFNFKKHRLTTLQQLAQMDAKDRRSILRFLNDEQYNHLIKVLAEMPVVEMEAQSQVVDDEAPTVYTAGAIVTVTIKLKRRRMEEFLTVEKVGQPNEAVEEEAKDEEEDKEANSNLKKLAWQKQNKKHKKVGKNKNKKGMKPKQPPTTTAANSTDANAANAETKPAKTSEENATEAGEESDNDQSHSENEDDSEAKQSKNKNNADDDDEEWKRITSDMLKRERALKGRSKISHPVHCPHFPDVKQEYWWLFMCNRKYNTLISGPIHVTSLVDEEELELYFSAPKWPGMFTFQVCLVSDSYVGLSQTQDIKLDVKEAAEAPTDHPQWVMPEEEEEPEDYGEPESEYTTDEDVDD